MTNFPDCTFASYLSYDQKFQKEQKHLNVSTAAGASHPDTQRGAVSGAAGVHSVYSCIHVGQPGCSPVRSFIYLSLLWADTHSPRFVCWDLISLVFLSQPLLCAPLSEARPWTSDAASQSLSTWTQEWKAAFKAQASFCQNSAHRGIKTDLLMSVLSWQLCYWCCWQWPLVSNGWTVRSQRGQSETW